MRVGLIGAGRIGAVHAASLAHDPRVTELVISDVVRSAARNVAGAVGARTADSVEGLLESGLDAVVIAAPTHTHAELLLRCSTLGVPIFCEKPVFADLGTAAEVQERIRAAGVEVHVGFQRRFDPGYVTAYTALRSGAIGELRRLHLITADPAPPPESYVAGSGGIHRDCQIHDFDILRWVSGREVEEVFVVGANRGADYVRAAGDVDEVVGVLTLDDGSLATTQASRYNGGGYDVRMELAGTEATVVVGLDRNAPIRFTEADAPELSATPWTRFLDRFAAAYRAEMSAFITMVANSTPSPCTIADAIQALVIAEAATVSRRERRPVRIEEVRASSAPELSVL